MVLRNAGLSGVDDSLRSPSRGKAYLVLPEELQRKLDLPTGRLRRSDQPRAAYRVPAFVEDVEVVCGRGEVRPIENIEELSTKLGIEVLRDLPYPIILEHREIEFRDPRPD